MFLEGCHLLFEQYLPGQNISSYSETVLWNRQMFWGKFSEEIYEAFWVNTIKSTIVFEFDFFQLLWSEELSELLIPVLHIILSISQYNNNVVFNLNDM